MRIMTVTQVHRDHIANIGITHKYVRDSIGIVRTIMMATTIGRAPDQSNGQWLVKMLVTLSMIHAHVILPVTIYVLLLVTVGTAHIHHTVKQMVCVMDCTGQIGMVAKHAIMMESITAMSTFPFNVIITESLLTSQGIVHTRQLSSHTQLSHGQLRLVLNHTIHNDFFWNEDSLYHLITRRLSCKLYILCIPTCIYISMSWFIFKMGMGKNSFNSTLTDMSSVL